MSKQGFYVAIDETRPDGSQLLGVPVTRRDLSHEEAEKALEEVRPDLPEAYILEWKRYR